MRQNDETDLKEQQFGGAAETASPPRRRMGRSIGAVIAGLFAGALPSVGTDAVLHATGLFPPAGQPMGEGLFLLATAYRCLFAVAGSAVAARSSPHRPMEHALVLGGLNALASFAGLVATWNAGPELGPKWYPIALVVLALPCAWAGGTLVTARSSAAATPRRASAAR